MNNNTERIAKNTGYLYLRSIFALLLRLYTTKLVLEALGVQNYGVYQLIGGVVSMTSFISGSLSIASNRFLSYEIGRGDRKSVGKVFSSLLTLHLLLAGLLFLLVITVGFALLHTVLDIGTVELDTASWVLFFSSCTLFLTISYVPYNCMLIAKENMSVFAYVDIFGEILKILIPITMICFSTNSLVLYGGLMFAQALVIMGIYSRICVAKYEEAKYKFIWDKSLLLKMTKFTGWTSLASITFMVGTSLTSFIINIFLGPLLNAAVGISNQINNAIKTFSTNFQMSFVPQIIKRYAEGDYERMTILVTSGAKISTFLFLAISVPFMIECDYALGLWLKDVPPYSAMIVCLILVRTAIQTMTCTGNTAIRATGKVARYEVSSNICELMALPVMLLGLYITPAYYIPFVSLIVFSALSNLIVVYFVKKSVDIFSIKKYVLEIFIKSPLLAVVAGICPRLICYYHEPSFMRLLLNCTIYEIIFITLIWFVGLNKFEKEIITGFTKKIIKYKS